MRPIKKISGVSMVCPVCGNRMFRIDYLDCGNILEESYRCGSCGHKSRIKSRMC